MIERVMDPKGPNPAGPYSHAVKAGGFIYVSGQASINPKTKKLAPGTVTQETHQTIKNIRSILKAAGAGLKDVIKCSVFLADIRDFAEMNKVYEEYFGAAKPARTTVSAALPAHGLKVEIDCVAYKE
ncbi:MAG: Rid family detoxifying hydrolase [Acidobacteria bacterium]|nr:Rid family detoxifying hydrolase [Acidobacteriota bacterium]